MLTQKPSLLKHLTHLSSSPLQMHKFLGSINNQKIHFFAGFPIHSFLEESLPMPVFSHLLSQTSFFSSHNTAIAKEIITFNLSRSLVQTRKQSKEARQSNSANQVALRKTPESKTIEPSKLAILLYLDLHSIYTCTYIYIYMYIGTYTNIYTYT